MKKLRKPKVEGKTEAKQEAKPGTPAVSGFHLMVYKNCDEGKEFIFPNGKRVKNLIELAEAIAELDHGSFSHHVNSAKNDFATWVEDVFGEKALAEKLRRSHSIERHEI